ncbi:MAG TPA: MaoC/PaaZ C-terminal domain-containing protein [Actinomycetota bacterium]
MTVRLEDVNVGDAVPDAPRLVTREDVRAYAEASGDRNPLHLDDEVARAVGFPGIIAHGMFTTGHLVSTLVGWAGDHASIVRVRVQFRSPVLMGDTVVAGGAVKALDPERRTALLDVWVRIDRDGATEWAIRRGEAEIRLA